MIISQELLDRPVALLRAKPTEWRFLNTTGWVRAVVATDPIRFLVETHDGTIIQVDFEDLQFLRSSP